MKETTKSRIIYFNFTRQEYRGREPEKNGHFNVAFQGLSSTTFEKVGIYSSKWSASGWKKMEILFQFKGFFSAILSTKLKEVCY